MSEMQFNALFRSKFQVKAAALIVLLVALTLGAAGCGGSSGGSTSSGSTQESSSSGGEGGSGGGLLAEARTSDVEPAEFQHYLEDVFYPGFEKSELKSWELEAFEVLGAQPLTKEQEEFVAECTEGTTCERSTGKYTVGIADGVGIIPWRKTARVTMLVALSHMPAVKKVIYTEGKGELPKMLSDMRSLTAQGVDVIVGQFDGGNAELPAIKQAVAAGVPVIGWSTLVPDATYEGDLSFGVALDTCKTGTEYGELSAEAAPNATVALATGPAGNSYAAAWQPCAKKAIEEAGAEVVYEGNTEWTPQGEAQVASSLLAQGLPDALAYDYGQTTFDQKFAAAGEFPKALVGGAQTMGGFKEYFPLKEKYGFTSYSYTSQAGFSAPAAFLAIAELEHEVPAEAEAERRVVLPGKAFPLQELKPFYVPAAGAEAPFGSGLAEKQLVAAQKASG